MKHITVTAVICLLLLGSKKITYQIYDCPYGDNDGKMFAEDSPHIHRCSGTSEKPHIPVVMVWRGKTVITTK